MTIACMEQKKMGENTKNSLGVHTDSYILLIFREYSSLKMPVFLSGNVSGKGGWSDPRGQNEGLIESSWLSSL